MITFIMAPPKYSYQYLTDNPESYNDIIDIGYQFEVEGVDIEDAIRNYLKYPCLDNYNPFGFPSNEDETLIWFYRREDSSNWFKIKISSEVKRIYYFDTSEETSAN